MYWTLEMASKLEDAPWPATKAELIDYAQRSGLPQEILENLDELEDEGIAYDGIEETFDWLNILISTRRTKMICLSRWCFMAFDGEICLYKLWIFT